MKRRGGRPKHQRLPNSNQTPIASRHVQTRLQFSCCTENSPLKLVVSDVFQNYSPRTSDLDADVTTTIHSSCIEFRLTWSCGKYSLNSITKNFLGNRKKYFCQSRVYESWRIGEGSCCALCDQGCRGKRFN